MSQDITASDFLGMWHARLNDERPGAYITHIHGFNLSDLTDRATSPFSALAIGARFGRIMDTLGQRILQSEPHNLAIYGILLQKTLPPPDSRILGAGVPIATIGHILKTHTLERSLLALRGQESTLVDDLSSRLDALPLPHRHAALWRSLQENLR
jgi:hypothetical protein